MELIAKLFIKDYKDTKNPTVRFRYGTTAGIIGIVVNAILFAFKLLIGIIGNSITIIADAINNLSDTSSSAVTLFGFKIAAKPADKEHPYGHARFEYIAAFMVTMLIFAVGAMLLKYSIEKIISPSVTTVTIYTYIILAASILMKVFLLFLYRNFANKIDSSSLKASSQDSLNDIITTTIVLISTIIIDIVGPTKVSIDGIFGVIISIYIILSIVKLTKEIINSLIGAKPDPELVKSIVDAIMSYDKVLGIHDLMLHNYGVGINILMVHVEVDANMSIMDSHSLADEIEVKLEKDFNIKASIHIDPIVVDNPEVNRLKQKVIDCLNGFDEQLKIHDFRVVFCANSNNIIFDVVVPFSDQTTLQSINEALNKSFENESKLNNFVIKVDRGE